VRVSGPKHRSRPPNKPGWFDRAINAGMHDAVPSTMLSGTQCYDIQSRWRIA
jgi:hypothetical protein